MSGLNKGSENRPKGLSSGHAMAALKEAQKEVRDRVSAESLKDVAHRQNTKPVKFRHEPTEETGGGGKRKGGDEAASPKLTPFQVTLKSGGATVRPGMVNGLVPTGYVGDLNFSGDRFVTLDITTDGIQVTSILYNTSVNSPTPPTCSLASPPAAFSIALALVAGGVVYQIIYDNISVGMNLCKQTERSNPPAGTSPWDNWFTWSIS